MTYKIDYLNNSLEIVNPTIEIIGLAQGNPRTTRHDYPNFLYDVDVRLYSVGNYDFIINLKNVTAESWDLKSQGAKMPLQVLTALNEQFAI